MRLKHSKLRANWYYTRRWGDSEIHPGTSLVNRTVAWQHQPWNQITACINNSEFTHIYTDMTWHHSKRKMRNAGKVASNLSHANLATGQHTAWFGEKQSEEHHRRAFGKGTVDLLHTISAIWKMTKNTILLITVYNERMNQTTPSDICLVTSGDSGPSTNVGIVKTVQEFTWKAETKTHCE